MSCLPKPVLRGHIKRRGLRGLIGAVCFGCFNGALYHFFVTAPRKAAYAKFIETYDADSHYNEMVKLGYINPTEFFASLKGN